MGVFCRIARRTLDCIALCLIRWMKGVNTRDLGSTKLQFRLCLVDASVVFPLANLLVLVSGSVIGWASPIVTRLLDSDDASPLSVFLLVVVFFLIVLASTVPAHLLGDILGRRVMLVVSAALILSSWALMPLGGIVVLFFGRVLGGLGVGAALTTTLTYVGEISQKEIREYLGAALQLTLYFGIFLAYVLCYACSDIISSIIYVILIILYLLAVFFSGFPESPYYLVRKKRNDDAEFVLKRLRQPCDERAIQLELYAIKEYVASPDQHIKAMMEDKKATFVLLGVILFQQLCGFVTVVSYMGELFRHAGYECSNPLAAAAGAALVVCCLFSARFVDRTERKAFLLASCIATSIAYWTLGAFFYAHDAGLPTRRLRWLVVASVALFLLAFAAGLGPLPSLLVADLLPARRTARVALALSVWSRVMAVVAVFVSVPVAYRGGLNWLFWFFGCCCLLGAAFVYAFVPEYDDEEKLQNTLTHVKHTHTSPQ